MKLNNRGFAISSIMYIILVLAVVLIFLTLATLSSRKLILDKLKSEVYNDIYDRPSISYRKVLNTLKEEVIDFATDNSIEKDSIKIEDIDSSIDSETLEKYDLSSKYLTMENTTDSYDIYLGKEKTISGGETVKKIVDIVDYKIYGNTYQETRNGINLLNNYDIWESTSTVGALNNAVINEEYIEMVRQAKYDYAYISISLKAGKTYTLWYEYEIYGRPEDDTTQPTKIGVGFSAKSTVSILKTQNGIYNYITTYTPKEDIDTDVRLFANYGSTVPAKVRFKIMVVEGSYTLDTIPDYEPYGESPSPEFPSEVKGVGDLITDEIDVNYGKYAIPVTISGKNLFNANAITNSAYTINNSEVSVNVLDAYSSVSTGLTLRELCPSLKSGETYTISYESIQNSHISLGAYTTENFWNDGQSKIITDNDLNAIVSMGDTVAESGTRTIVFSNIQVEKGTTSTEYESYVEPITTNIYINESLRKIGDFADYIDFENKKIVRKIKEHVLDGSEKWEIDETGIYIPADELIKLNDYSNAIMSNKLSITPSHSSTKELSISGYNDSSHIYINKNWLYFKNSSLETSSDVITWFTENPVKTYYQLATQFQEIQEFPKIRSNIGSVNISIDTDIQPSNVEFTVIERIIKI